MRSEGWSSTRPGEELISVQGAGHRAQRQGLEEVGWRSALQVGGGESGPPLPPLLPAPAPPDACRLRMADLPHPADEVLFSPGLWVPLVVIQNVFVLPG